MRNITRACSELFQSCTGSITETRASGLAACKIGIEPQYRNGARLIKLQFPEC